MNDIFSYLKICKNIAVWSRYAGYFSIFFVPMGLMTGLTFLAVSVALVSLFYWRYIHRPFFRNYDIEEFEPAPFFFKNDMGSNKLTTYELDWAKDYFSYGESKLKMESILEEIDHLIYYDILNLYQIQQQIDNPENEADSRVEELKDILSDRYPES